MDLIQITASSTRSIIDAVRVRLNSWLREPKHKAAKAKPPYIIFFLPIIAKL